MSRLLSMTVAVVLLLIPGFLMAGGLPRLCVPIDGVTSQNADACEQLVSDGLGREIYDVGLKQNDGQWYLLLKFNRDRVRLGEIDAALASSPFSVPRDKLRLFGDAVFEIELRGANADKLLADLQALKSVKVSESNRTKESLVVTLTMTGPMYLGRTDEFGTIPFKSESFPSANPSDTPVRLNDLPTYQVLSDVIEKHKAKVASLGWGGLSCRVWGCVADDEVIAKSRQAEVAR